MKRKAFEAELRRLSAEMVALDLESHHRWYDYARARLNVMAHFLSLFPYSELAPNDITLPPRQDAAGYEELDLSFALVPERSE